MKILTIEDLARGFRDGYAPEGNVLDAYGTMAEQYTEYLTGYSMEEQIANNGGVPDNLKSTCHQIANHLLSHEILTHGDFFSKPFHIPPFILMQLEPYSKSGLRERIEEFNKTYGKFGKKSNMDEKHQKSMALAIAIIIDNIRDELQKIIGDNDVQIGFSMEYGLIIKVDGTPHNFPWKEIERMRNVFQL